MFKNKEKIKLDLIFEKDLKFLLQKFNLFDKFKNGEIKCDVCGETINGDNLALIKVKKGKLIFFCDKNNCSGEAK